MHVPMRESLLVSPTLLVLNVQLHQQYSCSRSSCGTILPSIVHERRRGDDPIWQGVSLPAYLFGCICVRMNLMPTPIKKPTTLMKGRPSANPRAYLPAFSEKRSATITSVFSLKIAPLRRRWLLVRSKVLAPPREAQLRSALSKKAPRRSALPKEAPYRVAL